MIVEFGAVTLLTHSWQTWNMFWPVISCLPYQPRWFFNDFWRWLDILCYLEGNKEANDAISSALPVSGCPIISFRLRSERGKLLKCESLSGLALSRTKSNRNGIRLPGGSIEILLREFCLTEQRLTVIKERKDRNTSGQAGNKQGKLRNTWKKCALQYWSLTNDGKSHADWYLNDFLKMEGYCYSYPKLKIIYSPSCCSKPVLFLIHKGELKDDRICIYGWTIFVIMDIRY